MTAEPTTKDVEFSIRRLGSGKLHGKFDRSPPGKSDQEVDFENVNKAGLLVNLTLTDDGGTGLRFPAQPARAIWVHPVEDKHGPCPGEGASWESFEPISVSSDGTTLTVRDPNERPELFKFSLNFTLDRQNPEGSLEHWDPIGQNKNGAI